MNTTLYYTITFHIDIERAEDLDGNILTDPEDILNLEKQLLDDAEVDICSLIDLAENLDVTVSLDKNGD
jgi:hypothetical protein